MLETIQQNPLVATILILVPCIAVAWKVLDVLYVKPRDFRITTLEKQVEELRNELLRTPPAYTMALQHEQAESGPTSVSSHTSESSPAVAPHDPLLSLNECYRQWRDRDKTDLQRKRFEESYVGKTVSWDAYVDSVDKSQYSIAVSASADPDPRSDARVLAWFPLAEEAELLAFKKGDKIKVVGTIRDFFLSPQVDGSTIERIT